MEVQKTTQTYAVPYSLGLVGCRLHRTPIQPIVSCYTRKLAEILVFAQPRDSWLTAKSVLVRLLLLLLLSNVFVSMGESVSQTVSSMAFIHIISIYICARRDGTCVCVCVCV